jgi:hypothetical protein
MSEQFEFGFTKRKFTGYEKEIDWDSVSGIDLADNPRLHARWMQSDERKREEIQMRGWAKNIRNRRRTEYVVI